MKKGLLYWVAAIVLSTCIFSCNEYDDDYVELKDEEITFEAEGGAQTTSITVNGGWVIIEAPEWCTSTPSYGTMSSDIVLFAMYNKGEEREGTLKVKRGDAETSMVIKQKKVIIPAIVLDKREVLFTREGGKETIKVTANSEWALSTELPEWCKLNKKSGNESTEIIIEAEPNEETTKRELNLIFKSGTAQAILKVTQGENTFISVDKENISIPSEGGSEIIQLTASGAWSIITEVPDWCSIEPSSGEGNTEVTVTITPYTGEGKRELTLEMQSGEAVTEISIAQYDDVALNQDELKFKADEGNSTINLTANGNWRIIDEIPEWCTISPITGEKDAELTISVSENINTEERKANLKIERGNASTTLNIIQEKANDAISFDKTEILFIPEGGTETVALIANGGWQITDQIPEWCSVNITKGDINGNATLSITAGTNEGNTEKSVRLTFKRGEAEAFLTIKQNKSNIEEPSISLNEESISFEPAGGNKSVSLTTNGAWEIITAIPSWCRITPTSGDTSTELRIEVDENTESAPRSEILRIKRDEATIITLTIEQSGVIVPTIELSKDDLSFTSEGGEETIRFETNGPWEITSLPDDWCSVNYEQAEESKDVIITVSKNETGQDRSTSLEIERGTATATLTISQTKQDIPEKGE